MGEHTTRTHQESNKRDTNNNNNEKTVANWCVRACLANFVEDEAIGHC